MKKRIVAVLLCAASVLGFSAATASPASADGPVEAVTHLTNAPSYCAGNITSQGPAWGAVFCSLHIVATTDRLI